MARKKLSNSQKTRIRAAYKKLKTSRARNSFKRKLSAALKKGGYTSSSSSSKKTSGSNASSSRTSNRGNYNQVSASKASAARASIDRARRAVRERARKKAAAAKKQYSAATKKYGSGKNIINAAIKKYGANSSQAKKIRAYVQKNEKYADKKTAQVSKVRTNTQQKVSNKVNTKKGFTQNQYNKLISKYGTVEKINAAAINKYGQNSSQAKKVKELLNKYNSVSKPEVKKVRENTNVITDAKKRAVGDDFNGIDTKKKENKKVILNRKPKINEKAVFGKKWNSAERMNAAKKYGIDNYTGTAKQNILLRKKIRADVNTNTTNETNKDPNDFKNQTEENTLGGSEKTVVAAKRLTKEEKTKRNTDKLKEWRLSGKTDSDLLAKAEAKYGKDSKEYAKVKGFLDKNPEKDGTEEVNSDMLKKDKEELNESQIDALENQKDDNISTTAENFIKGSEVIAGNNEALQSFYKTMATDLQAFIETSTKTKNDALERTKTSELNKITGRIRALLARRGVDISNISPEQLIAMSGEVGGQALDAINEAISKTESEILDLTEKKTAEINKYLEQGLIKQGEADASIEQMRQLKEKMIADIKSNYITNAFKISRANIQDKDNNKAEVMNTVSKFVTQLGLSGTAQSVMEKYVDNLDSVEAMKEMISDLNDKNSELYKAVADIEKAAELQRELQAKVAILKATPKRRVSSGRKTTGGGTKKIGETTMRSLVAAGVPNASSYQNYGQLETAIQKGGDTAKLIQGAISKANVGIEYQD